MGSSGSYRFNALKKIACALFLSLFLHGVANAIGGKASPPAGASGGGSINAILNQPTLQSGTTAFPEFFRTENIGLSTPTAPGIKINARATTDNIFERLLFDAPSGFFNTFTMMQLYTTNLFSSIPALKATIAIASSVGEIQFIIKLADNAQAFAFDFASGRVYIGKGVGALVGNNTVNLFGSVGAAQFDVNGSTTIPTTAAPNYGQVAYMYSVNATGGNAVVTLEQAGTPYLPYGRLHKFCKSDSSPNTVSIGSVVLRDQYQCVEFIARAPNPGGSAVWTPAGITFPVNSMPTCDDTAQKLIWNGSSFTCTTDQTGGGGSATYPSDIFASRLTTESGVPISSSERFNQATLYYTSGHGELYDGAHWAVYSYGQLSISLSSIVDATNYDVFLTTAGGGNVQLAITAWADDTTRAVALSLQDGAYVKATDVTRRYVGTIRASGSGVTERSLKRNFVWNMYNRTDSPMIVKENAASWAAPGGSVRPWNNNDANRAEIVVGIQGDEVEFMTHGAENGGINEDNYLIGIGINRDDGNDTQLNGSHAPSNVSNQQPQAFGLLRHVPAAGYTYYQIVEAANNGGDGIVYGSNNSYRRYGMEGTTRN